MAGAGCAPQLGDDADRLRRRLAGGVDDLRIAGAQPAVRVDAGVPKVGPAVAVAERAGCDARQRIVRLDRAGSHGFQQEPNIRRVHAPTLRGPVVPRLDQGRR